MRLEQQKRKKENKSLEAIKRFFFIVGLIIFIIVSSAVGFGLGTFIEQRNYIEGLGKIEVPEATLIYAVNENEETGQNEIIAKLCKENRINIPLSEIPQKLQNAVISIEDKRFYEHNGVDIRGVARALVTNVVKGGYSQGASTISMQLARNVKLNSKKTLSRKLQEIVIAAQIEQTMTKEQILEAYLNSIYFGSGAFGVETASQVYYGKHAKDIDLSEAALLAGLPKAPSQYSPHNNYDASISRRNVVLKAMYEEGYITKDEYNDAKNEKIEIKEKSYQKHKYKYPQLTNAILDELKDRFDEDQIYNGGLRVFTTIDTRIQDAAEKAVQSHMKNVRKRQKNIECALISMNPATGFIAAMVGSVDPTVEFNRCTQAKRQPGSVFKPIVYYTAMEQLKWTPDTKISNERLVIGDWKPKNFDGRYGGHPTMRTAIYRSINLPAIRAGQAAGMDNVCNMAKRLGIDSKLEPYLATCIGAGNIKLVEMLQVYNVTANNGKIFTPTIIKQVYDTSMENCLVDNTNRQGKKVLSSDLVKTMDNLLRGVVTSGTGRPVRGISEARGKTGTNGKTDVSFAGYVPGGLSAMVWIGDDNFKPIPNSFSGGGTCGPIWAQFMKEALPYFKEDKEKAQAKIDKKAREIKEENKETEGEVVSNTETDNTTDQGESTYSQEDDNVDMYENYDDADTNEDTIYIDVCPASNKLPNTNCPSTVLKKFKSENAPEGVCDIH